MSNFERIKSMNIDELAAFLTELLGGESIDPAICQSCFHLHNYCMAENNHCSCPRNVNKEWLLTEAM